MENQTDIKQNRILIAKEYLTKHNIIFNENDTMTKLETLVENNEKLLRKQERANKKVEVAKQVKFKEINKDNFYQALYNLKGTAENPYKVSSKFDMTIKLFESELKTNHNDLYKLFEVHKENWLGTKLNQPTISVNSLEFYKENFKIDYEQQTIQQTKDKDNFEDEEIF